MFGNHDERIEEIPVSGRIGKGFVFYEPGFAQTQSSLYIATFSDPFRRRESTYRRFLRLQREAIVRFFQIRNESVQARRAYFGAGKTLLQFGKGAAYKIGSRRSVVVRAVYNDERFIQLRVNKGFTVAFVVLHDYFARIGARQRKMRGTSGK